MAKKKLDVDVYTAACRRIEYIFNTFEKIYISFSGGKDSTTILHMVMDVAIKKNCKIGLLFIDLEGQYKITIDHIHKCLETYREYICPFYWVALPLNLRNAVSQYEPQWMCWDPEAKESWVRNPPEIAIKDESYFPFYTHRMEFEDFVEKFGEWYADGKLTACLVGNRSDESLNRYRMLVANKQRIDGHQWTTYKGTTLFNCYPIYDWQTRDIWIYAGKSGKPHNKLYDYMYRAGLSIHQQRICQPYGDDQRKGLWLFHIIEPATWARIVARVNGANAGATYAREKGNILGNTKITKPKGHTWESFSLLLLESMPKRTAEHFKNKIAVFLRWWQDRGYPKGIPDEMDAKIEAARKVPSWRRICKALLRYDYWCKGLSFSQHKSNAYEKYLKVMKRRRRKWGIFWT